MGLLGCLALVRSNNRRLGYMITWQRPVPGGSFQRSSDIRWSDGTATLVDVPSWPKIGGGHTFVLQLTNITYSDGSGSERKL